MFLKKIRDSLYFLNFDNFFLNITDFSKTVFGFWIYLMGDCIIFSVLFIVFSIMAESNLFFLKLLKSICSIKFIFLETFFLLLSSLTYSIGILYLKKLNIKKSLLFLFFSFFLGIFFIFFSIYELYNIILMNLSPTKNGFLSSFFTLLIVHLLHVFFGLIWLFSLIIKIYIYQDKELVKDSSVCLGLFWHFLDIIWIIMYSYVFLFKIFSN